MCVPPWPGGGKNCLSSSTSTLCAVCPAAGESFARPETFFTASCKQRCPQVEGQQTGQLAASGQRRARCADLQSSAFHYTSHTHKPGESSLFLKRLESRQVANELSQPNYRRRPISQGSPALCLFVRAHPPATLIHLEAASLLPLASDKQDTTAAAVAVEGAAAATCWRLAC